MYRTMAEMKEIDRIAIKERGIPSLDLMENAASAVAGAALKQIPAGAEVLVICGTGNNGGDGYAAARLLADRGCSIYVYLVGDPAKLTPDSKANISRLLKMNLPVRRFDPENRSLKGLFKSADLIIDAIFGVGITREVTGIYLDAIHMINASHRHTIACDIPSGLNGDTGEAMGAAVFADETVTFTCPKAGLCINDGPLFAGSITVADIGIPQDVINGIGR